MTVTNEELKAMVKSRVMEFVGAPNNEETKNEILVMLTELFKQYPDQLDVIEQALKEGEDEHRAN
jgi:hypothetical protein